MDNFDYLRNCLAANYTIIKFYNSLGSYVITFPNKFLNSLNLNDTVYIAYGYCKSINSLVFEFYNDPVESCIAIKRHKYNKSLSVSISKAIKSNNIYIPVSTSKYLIKKEIMVDREVYIVCLNTYVDN